MLEYMGQIVQALAGRDQGGIFCVVGVDREQERLLLADGKRRKASHPKAKKPAHVRLLTEPQRGGFHHPAIQALQRGETVYDRELRRAIAAFKEEMSLGKG